MSEVKSFWCHEASNVLCVRASDFDNLTRLFLDAAERAVASERREKELQQRLTEADERADSFDRLYTSSLDERDQLQQRADVLEGLLLQTNELLYAIQGDPGAVPSSSIDAMRGEVFTALKHAKPETIAGHHPACRAVDDYKPGDCSHSCKPVAQPQGDPVAWRFRVSDTSDWFATTKVSVAEMFHNSSDGGQAQPLYTAQPAPVAVVMPERKTVSVGVLSESNTHNHGWNACIDELKRLNPSL